MNEKYIVALSFAGQDRVFAETVASMLRGRGITVFYDKFEQHELWGKDLFATLRQIYTQDCQHVIMILSPSYLERMWTKFERQQIIEKLAVNHGQDAVLPVRLEGFEEEVPGLSKGIGYLSVSADQASLVVDNLLKKLGRTGYEIDSAEAYERTLRMLARRDAGVLSYDRMYTSTEAMTDDYGIVRGDVLNWFGDEYVWKKQAGQPLVLYAQNEVLDEVRPKGLVELCKFEAPEAWVGSGRWAVYWLRSESRDTEKNTYENPPLFIALYLGSPNTDGFSFLLENEEIDAAFLAALLLKDENAQRFYDRAKNRFRDLR